jgi:uncharacterized protein DUF2637
MSAIPLPAAARSRWTEQRPTTSATVRGLKGIRWAVRATLILGVTASVAANVLHAQQHLISQLIAAWPPVALLLTVELISRVPVYHKLLAAARLLATTAIAGIAAWVSYWHMVGVAGRYGETGLSAYLLPISVDGLIVVASISLVELSARLQVAQSMPATPQPAPTADSVSPGGERPAAISSPGNPPETPASDAPADEPTIGEPAPADPADRFPSDEPEPSMGDERQTPDGSGGNQPSANDEPDRDDEPHGGGGDDSDDDNPGGDPRQPRRRGTTRQAVINAYREDPTQRPTVIAETVGTSERTVRRYLDEYRADPSRESRNGSNGAAHAHNGSRR